MALALITLAHYFITTLHPSRTLRLSKQNLLAVTRVKTGIGSRGFWSSGPRLGNALPDSLRSRAQFKGRLFREYGL